MALDDRSRAIEADRGAGLPHRDEDPVMRLVAHYLEPADYMLKQYDRLGRALAAGKPPTRARVRERLYFLNYWLSGLYVTLEGIVELPLATVLQSRPLDMPLLAVQADEVIALFQQHRDPLRRLRNGTFHYQPTAAKHLQFFSQEEARMAWARELHRKTLRLFADYRVQAMIICALAWRTDEIDIGRRRSTATRPRALPLFDHADRTTP